MRHVMIAYFIGSVNYAGALFHFPNSGRTHSLLSTIFNQFLTSHQPPRTPVGRTSAIGGRECALFGSDEFTEPMKYRL